MIERAAKALERACEGDVTRLPILNPRTWDTPMSAVGVTSKDAARAALLAALDPEDGELVEALTQRVAVLDEHDWVKYGHLVRFTLVALKEMAQGEASADRNQSK